MSYARSYSLMILLFPSFAVISAEMNLPQSPLQNRGYVSPNVMLMMDNSGSMGYRPPGESTGPVKLEIAKSVAIGVVQANPDIRFCLAKFNLSQGGQIVNTCEKTVDDSGQPQGTLIQNINGLTASTWTPLAETHYEVSRYFAGKTSAYNSNVSYTSPIQYRCQKNFTLVLTDGEGTKEDTFPDFSAMNDINPITTQNYDGVNNDGAGSSNSNFDLLDDFAKYAWDADFKPTGTDDANKSYEDPTIIAGGEPGRQNMHTYTVGFAIDDPMLVDAAAYGHGIYSTANTAEELTESFNNALKDINSKSQSVSAIASSSEFLLSGTDLSVFQSRYYANDWTSELFAWKLNDTTYELESTPIWSAPHTVPAWNSRIIYTGYSNGKLFKKSTFTSTDYQNWLVDSGNIIPYLRGRMGHANDVNRRIRTSLLGDVINSSPVYVTPPVKGLFGSDALGTAYDLFAVAHKTRKNMLFVGSNDGMLHGYDAQLGTEVLNFYPSKVLPNLKKLTKPDYEHQFYVDGTPTVGPIYDTTSNTWRTLLVGGLRRGGQGIYALDISDPALFTLSNVNAAKVVRWEFGDNNDVDFGYSYSQPQIMRLNDGKFYVAVGNGYNSTEADGVASTTGNAVLYLLNIEDGSIKKKMSTAVGTAQDPTGRGIGNGLSTVTGFDEENDGITDYVYGGDLFGNVWRFDLTDVDPDNWATSKLFTACGGTTCATGLVNNNHQPITSAIEVVKSEYNKVMLFFGSGKLLEPTDTVIGNVQKQSFYGIEDYNGQAISSRSQLLEQKILYSGTADLYTKEIRVTTDNKIKTQKGWFIDISVPTYPSSTTLKEQINQSVLQADIVYTHEGEQILAKARYAKGVVTFFTKAASNQILDSCSDISAKSFTMELNALSGSRLATVRSDVNNDGKIDEKDSLDTGKTNTLGDNEYIVISGKAGGNGSGSIDITVTDDQGNVTEKVISLNSGNSNDGNGGPVDKPDSKAVKTGFRTSWREITND